MQKADDPPEETGDDFDALVNESDGKLETESGEEDGNDTDALLNELEECFGSNEKCGDSILDKLAKVTNDGLRTKLDGSKIKETTGTYLRPTNVDNLKTPRVNNEILRHLSRKVRNLPQLQLIDVIMKKQKAKEKLTCTEIAKFTTDALKIMTFAYCYLYYRRREIIIQPGRKEDFQSLCFHDNPVTDNLFGDDLEKIFEGIVKRNKRIQDIKRS